MQIENNFFGVKIVLRSKHYGKRCNLDILHIFSYSAIFHFYIFKFLTKLTIFTSVNMAPFYRIFIDVIKICS